jgi:hypothetical protein
MARNFEFDVSNFAANPGAPSVSQVGAPGATAYSYEVVAVDERGNRSAASPAGSTSTGNATLGGGNGNRLTWTEVPGAVGYDIYRTASGGSPASIGKIATQVVAPPFDDMGAAGDLTSPPTVNQTGVGDAEDVTDLRDLTTQLEVSGGSGSLGGVLVEAQIEGAATWYDATAFGPITVPATGILVTCPASASFTRMRVRQTTYSAGILLKAFGAGHGRV